MIRTRSGLPKHCSWNVDRHGKRRVRFRKAGFSTYLTGIPWSEEFMRQYGAALDGVKERASNVGSARTIPGSFDALCVSYYRSPEFRGLKASTQAVRRNIIERFRLEHGRKPIARLERAHIKDIVGAKADTPHGANNLLKILRVMLSYAVDIGMVTSNPALGIKKFKSRNPDGHHIWTETEVTQFEAAHPVGTRARLALELLLSTGQRRGDVVRMGRQHIEGDCIAIRQEKTDEPLLVPIDEPLAAALAALPRTNLTFLVTEFGKPFTSAGFGNWFRDRCNEAELPQCSAQGCASLRLRDSRTPVAAASRSRRSPGTDQTRRSPPTFARPTRRGLLAKRGRC